MFTLKLFHDHIQSVLFEPNCMVFWLWHFSSLAISIRGTSQASRPRTLALVNYSNLVTLVLYPVTTNIRKLLIS